MHRRVRNIASYCTGARSLAYALGVMPTMLAPALGQCEQKLVPSDPTDSFGATLAIDSDWIVVGARSDDSAANGAGAAYFFDRQSLSWAETQKVTAMDAEAGDAFGLSVSISREFAVVGAYGNDDMGDDSGSAYVFEYVSGAWVEVAKLLAPDGGADNRFGGAVSVSGDTAVVGSNIGAYVFERMPGLGWIFVDKLTPASGAVAISGDHILTGGHAFERIGQVWTDAGSLTASGDSDQFGYSISISGDRAVIGAYAADDFGGNSGAAYVFAWNGTAWVEDQRLLASGGVAGDVFGLSVSISEERLVVGAPNRSSQTGAAYIFDWDGIEWDQVSRLEASDGAGGHRLGYAVALRGDDAIIGAHQNGDGAAYAYTVPCIDCNGNLVLDSTDIANATSMDCNSNGIPDECDIAVGTSPDCQSNGIPDECEIGIAYCYCGSGAPCGNEDSEAGCANVTGHGAAVSACGTPSIAADDLVISASGVLPNVSGLFFMGGGNMNQVPFGDGQLCVFSGMQGVKRYRPSNAGAAAVISLGPGVAGIAEMRWGAGIISPGQTWHFQCWYRDPIGPCGNGYNMSNAVSITFAP
ncbi:MAG: hypothetical protein ACI9OJ_001619 [Myxococcota bacterium]|jgi:hypothetical protein